MAKIKTPEELVFEGLRRAYAALPELLPMIGSKSIFTAKQAELAEQAIREGLLTTRKIASGKGKKPKETVYGELTEAGLRRILEEDSPKAVLESLLPAVQALGRPPSPAPSADSIRAEFDRATATCVKAIQEAFSGLQITTPSPPAADPGPVLSSLRAALERVEPPVIKATLPPQPQPAAPTRSRAGPVGSPTRPEGQLSRAQRRTGSTSPSRSTAPSRTRAGKHS